MDAKGVKGRFKLARRLTNQQKSLKKKKKHGHVKFVLWESPEKILAKKKKGAVSYRSRITYKFLCSLEGE